MDDKDRALLAEIAERDREWDNPNPAAPYVHGGYGHAAADRRELLRIVRGQDALLRERAERGGHPEAYCHRCGGWNLGGWHAPSPVWNAVMRRHDGPEPFDGIICPQCFEQLAEQFGVIDTERTGWHVHPEPTPDVPLTDADGRAWDPEQCLWVAAAEEAVR